MFVKYLKGTRYLSTEEKGDFELDYYLVQEEKNCYRTFGVEVIKKTLHGNKEVAVETERIHPISEVQKEALFTLDKLLYYTVTPTCLIEVIDEVIGMT